MNMYILIFYLLSIWNIIFHITLYISLSVKCVSCRQPSVGYFVTQSCMLYHLSDDLTSFIFKVTPYLRCSCNFRVFLVNLSTDSALLFILEVYSVIDLNIWILLNPIFYCLHEIYSLLKSHNLRLLLLFLCAVFFFNSFLFIGWSHTCLATFLLYFGCEWFKYMSVKASLLGQEVQSQ